MHQSGETSNASNGERERAEPMQKRLKVDIKGEEREKRGALPALHIT
tara:strand:- start:1628 stop:1768 length:141 start_codon:yes stop_codon:yes gene_type:complete